MSAFTLAGPSIPSKASTAIKAARILVIDAVDSEGLLQTTFPTADTDPALGVSQSDRAIEESVDIVATPGSIVELEVAAAVASEGLELMIDVTATFEGRVKPATAGKQVVAHSLMAQATVGKRIKAVLRSPYFKP